MADQPEGMRTSNRSRSGRTFARGSGSHRQRQNQPRRKSMTARVGQKAPDFNAPAYFNGSFTNVQLSDYFGKWILLCFYPGDFTFV